MKFVRRHPRIEKNINWGTPKSVQLDKLLENTDLESIDKEVVEPWHPKRKWPCRKLKGPHNFKEASREETKWYPGPGKTIYIEYRCTACNKKKAEYNHKMVDIVEQQDT